MGHTRYLVIDLRQGLSSRRVLVSPPCVLAADTSARRVEVSLEREQIRRAPDVDADRPVSRQHEIAPHEYYGAISRVSWVGKAVQTA